MVLVFFFHTSFSSLVNEIEKKKDRKWVKLESRKYSLLWKSESNVNLRSFHSEYYRLVRPGARAVGLLQVVCLSGP